MFVLFGCGFFLICFVIFLFFGFVSFLLLLYYYYYYYFFFFKFGGGGGEVSANFCWFLSFNSKNLLFIIYNVHNILINIDVST